MTSPEDAAARRRRDNAADQVAYAAVRLSEAHTAVSTRTKRLEERIRAAEKAGVPLFEIQDMTEDLGIEVTLMVRRIYLEKYDVTGADTVMYCLAHRRKVEWLPSPAWWIHDDSLPHTGHPGDQRGCSAMWDADAPITLTRKQAS